MAAPSGSASTTSNDLVELVQRLLRIPRPGADGHDAHPLAVVLLLLDCRHALAPSWERTETTSPRQNAIPLPDSIQDDIADDGTANTTSSAHHTYQSSTATGTAAEARSTPRSSVPAADVGTAVGAHARARAVPHCSDYLDDPNHRRQLPPASHCQLRSDWPQWVSYMEEVYTHPVEKDEIWASPLYVPRHVAPSLVSAMSEPEFNVGAQRLLQQSIDELEAYIITHFGFTCPLNGATATKPSTRGLASITSTLATARRCSPLFLANPTADLFCRVLSLSLEHLVSSECFGVSDGHARFALSEQDDKAIRLFPDTTSFETPRPKPVSRTSEYSGSVNMTSEEEGRGRTSFSNHLPRGSSTKTTPPKMTVKKARPMSIGSYSAETYTRSPSRMTFDSAQSSPVGHMRRDSRLSDTESMMSYTPLLAACSSPVSAAAYPSRYRPSSPPEILPPPVFIEDTGRGDAPSPSVPPLFSLIDNSSRSYTAKIDTSSPSMAPASRTNCTLSPDERRHFIRQAKKLEHLLGKPVKEAQAKAIVNAGSRNGIASLDADDRPSMRKKRSCSHPLVRMSVNETKAGSSTSLWSLQLGGQDMKRASSSPCPSSPSSPPGANRLLRVASPTSPGATTPLSPRTPTTPTSATDATTMAFKNREQRRKKLAKLHRLLGEKVPVELALSKTGSVSSVESIEAPGLWKSGTGAKRIWERAKGHVHAPWHSQARQHDEAELEQARRDEFIVDVEPDRQVFPLLTDETSAGREIGNNEGGSTTTSTSNRAAELKILATARKLEDRFGALPPKALFQSVQIKPPRTDHRVSSDSKASETSVATSVSSVASYRTSIASLRFLMEEDPEALDQIAVALHEEEEGEDTDGVEAYQHADVQEAKPSLHQQVEELSLHSDRVRSDEPIEEEPIDNESGSTLRVPNPTSLPPTPPTDSIAFPLAPVHRTPGATRGSVRKVNKLLNFFGTLRGEVWNRLLDDLQLAIEGDDEIEREDKAALLLDVQKLRAFKPVDERGDRGAVIATAAG
ncbi:BQ2448_4332 [Microbotryum intermedium]|uniref:BQ2448_4332 protein n=1 Tax=Microbotryum intermedium TaxID=269621 RepID=A0A238FI00_9BASI|nr:BQ2448_4332 [Microbotryum intermedium]